MKVLNAMLFALLLLVGTSVQVFAPHDHGLGKSQDHPDNVKAVTAAPEPVSALLFVAGAGLVFLRARRQNGA